MDYIQLNNYILFPFIYTEIHFQKNSSMRETFVFLFELSELVHSPS